MKVVHVIPSNSAVAQMASPFHKVHSTTDVIAHSQNSSAVPMKLLLPKDRTSRDVLVQRVNTVAVLMDIQKLKEATSMDVKTFQRHRKSLVVFQKTAVPVAISLLKTSLMLNMEHVLDSGTVDAAVMIIDSKQSKNAKVHAKRLREKVPVCYRKFMVLALDIIRRITMILTGICVHNSFMEVVWVTIIDSRQRKRVRNCASLIELCVSR